MATIPMGNFGQSVAQPQRATRAVANTGAAEALGQVAQTVQGIALDQMAAQTRLDQEARDIEAQTNAGRVRVKTINDASDLSDEISRGILDGTISKDKATEEWSARFKELTNGRLDGMDPRYAGPLQVAFEDLQARGLNGVRDTLTKRGQQDTQANLLTLREEYQRMATKDRPRAVLEYTAQLEAMGPKAGWGPEQIALKKQQFREDTAYTQATALVGSARDLNGVRKAREALASEAFADLDPQRKAQIEATLEGRETAYIQRAAAQEQARAARAQAALNRAQAAFTAAQARTDAGIPDSPEQVALTTQALAGTPFMETYRALQTQAREVGGFGAQSLPDMQKALDQINAQIAQNGASDALIKRRDSLQKTRDAAEAGYKDDALRAAVQRGVIDALPQIDVSSVDSATRTIGARLQAAQVVQTRTGSPVSPLTNDEAFRLGNMLQSLRPEDKAQSISVLSETIGPQAAQALAVQISKNDRPLALAMAAGSARTTGSTDWLGSQSIAPRPVSTLILKGQQAMKDKGEKAQDAPTKVRQLIADQLGDVLSGKTRDDVIEAASLIYMGMEAEGSGKDAKRALNLAAGGSVVKHNGRSIVMPAEMSIDVFRDRLGKIKAESLASQAPGGMVYQGGKAMSAREFLSTIPSATLEQAGSGRYFVRSGAGLAVNANGTPITIEVR